MSSELKNFLDQAVEKYNQRDFIPNDPILVPHKFSLKQDIEIIGFWTAMLAWGRRQTIISKSLELVRLMDGKPYSFILNHKEEDRKRFLDFKHRTFNAEDALYFLEFFQRFYHENESLEFAFSKHLFSEEVHVGPALSGFHNTFFELPSAPQRTRKHVATPDRNSKCKRLNMFLRWMARKDEKGVDFGIWDQIRPSQLLIPLDVHVERVARRLGLIERKQSDFKTVLELSGKLRMLNPADPAIYDFALFGMGVMETELPDQAG